MKKILVILIAILAISITSVSALALDGEEADAAATDELKVWIIENAGNMLSALSLVGTLFLAFTYKKGLMPRLTSALSTVSDGVREMKTSAESSTKKYEKSLSDTNEGCQRIEAGCERITSSVNALAERIESKDILKRECEKMNVVLLAQIEMLYDIFTTSSLPQYAKEEVGVKIAKMRAALTPEDENE